MAAFHLAAFALIGPMLVLCDDGDRHRTVESAMSLCCALGQAGSSDEIQPRVTPAEPGIRCADSCTDTPLLTSIDATSTKTVAQASETAALVLTFVLAPCLAPASAGQDAAFLPALSPPHLSRSTVLRI